MNRWVIDASVAAKIFFLEEHSEVMPSLFDLGNELLAPELILAEFGNVVWKRLCRKEIEGSAARAMLREFLRTPIQIFPTYPLAGMAWAIAQQYRRSFYDSIYLALAVRERCAMLTADRALQNALSRTRFARRLVHVGDLA